MSFAKSIKLIREELHLSQQALADELGVSFSTVNRWENEKHIPNKMTVNTISAFCKLKNITFKYIEEGQQ